MMIQKIRKSRSFKAWCITLALSIFFELVAPTRAMALTGGPAQPEFSSFTPIGTTDMVNLSSGDMTYNIPLMDVGGYPLNLAYSSGIGMDSEASWVGLGWDLSVGQVNRSVRGIPDDFNGDEITYENHLKPNTTVGASFQFTPQAFGVDIDAGDLLGTSLTLGLSATYNSYTGFSMNPSVGVQVDLSQNVSIGFNAESSADGLCVSPSLSLTGNESKGTVRNHSLGASVGVSMNSRQGLSSMTFGVECKNNVYNRENMSESGMDRGSMSIGSSIGFTDELYTPTKRVSMTTESFTINVAAGIELCGAEGTGQITAFGTTTSVSDVEDTRKSYGYANTMDAGHDGVLDFNREKDGNVSVNTNNLPVTNYTYDIYSVRGQGVSGMYRPYQSQIGYVFDPLVKDNSSSGSLGLEIGVGNTAHNGIDIEVTDIDAASGLWEDNNSALEYFEPATGGADYERVYYKNVGDLSSDRDYQTMFNYPGAYQPVRIPFVGNKFDRRALNAFNQKANWVADENEIGIASKTYRSKRQLRNQSIVNVKIKDLLTGVGYGPCVKYGSGPNDFVWGSQGVSLANRPDHHVGEVQITRNDGARYIYGLPVYNNTKVEATFSVDANGNCNSGLVGYNSSQLDSPEDLPNDQYLERVTTPEYAHTYLLTSILSTDYSDRGDAFGNFNGPTPDDYGSYTKFTYENYNDINGTAAYKWRMPYADASFNEGLKTDPKDDRGNYVYGEKEMYLVKTIETKTHIADFFYSERHDAHGVMDEQGTIDVNNNSYKLDSIRLFSIEEYAGGNGIPIKVAHFEYSYDLCQGVPNNDGIADSECYGRDPVTGILSSNINNKGKLTLEKVYFTYRHSDMGKYTAYKFAYCNLNPENPTGGYSSDYNPQYNIKGYDTWGNYKPNVGGCGNLDNLNASEFPYTDQDKTEQNKRAQVWCMTRVDLPSGGNIDVTYESDDYDYVQDKSTMRMFKVVGAGVNPTPPVASTNSAELFGDQVGNTHNQYLYVEIDDNAQATDVAKYLQGFKNNLIYFRFLMNMTELGGTSGNESEGKFDYVTGYFELGSGAVITPGSPAYLSLPMKMVDKNDGNNFNVNPISKAAWHFARKYLSKYAYSNQPNDENSDLEDIAANMLGVNTFNGLVEMFTGPNATLENKNVGRRFITDKSWVRLSNPRDYKLGGGCRVKEIHMNDIWEQMQDNPAGFESMSYGQSYDYTREDGGSSGVASYEPIGNKENPFVQPVYSTTKHLLAPDEENYIEEPFGESFYPNPEVTYSRVTVSNVTAGAPPSGVYTTPVIKTLHKTGRVVSEFYTTKDYPTIVDQTILQAEEDKNELLDNILKINVRKHFTASQGYVIHTNDMNGKEKAKWVYAEGQDSPISGVRYLYDNYATPDQFSADVYPTENSGKLINEVVVIRPDGTVGKETIGVEVDIINDFRENHTNTDIGGVNTNIATFLIGVIPGMVPIPLPDFSHMEDQFRSVGTTKVVQTFGLLKETIAYDAGAAVSTRNLAWDQYTGEVLLTQTVDEFSDEYYTINYPAHWYYDGMGQAALNVEFEGYLSSIGSGQYTMSNAGDYLLAGDEIQMKSSGTLGWISDVDPNTDIVTVIDKTGALFTLGSDGFKVIRSGHRNLQSGGIMNVTLMTNPLLDVSGNLVSDIYTDGGPIENFLVNEKWNTWYIINAGAVDYSDDWLVGCECGVNNLDPVTGGYNPYRINEKGVWRTKSSRTYLTGRNYQNEVTPRRQGFFNHFEPMYKKPSLTADWTKDFTNWTYVAEVSQYSPYGFELENKDALDRYSAAQYGYNNTFPMAVGANTKYNEIGFDGFEDHFFGGCPYSPHFQFENNSGVTDEQAHTGKYSIQVGPGARETMEKKLDCSAQPPQP